MAGTYRYRIEPRDIDATLRVRLYSLGDLVLQAANDDADMLGFGVRDINLGNASWVLSRMAVEMRRLPSRHEAVDIYTWVSDYGRLFTTRNMTLADGEGVEIGAAVTLWAMIDLDTRRPLDLSPLSNKGTSLVDRDPPIEKPRKVGTPTDTGYAKTLSERTCRVAYSDIDFNGHVNSMKYLEWMVDVLMTGPGEEIIRCGHPLRFDINYIQEAKLGEQLTICSGRDDGGVYHFDIRNASGTSICKAAIMSLQPQ